MTAIYLNKRQKSVLKIIASEYYYGRHLTYEQLRELTGLRRLRRTLTSLLERNLIEKSNGIRQLIWKHIHGYPACYTINYVPIGSFYDSFKLTEQGKEYIEKMEDGGARND